MSVSHAAFWMSVDVVVVVVFITVVVLFIDTFSEDAPHAQPDRGQGVRQCDALNGACSSSR